MRVDGLHDLLTGEDFSGVVLLRRGDDTVFEGAYGLASPRWGVANAMDTRFDTASITKLFTSVAVLQLVGRGELELDTSIHTYADLSGTTISSEVTLRHLLTHTSGSRTTPTRRSSTASGSSSADPTGGSGARTPDQRNRQARRRAQRRRRRPVEHTGRCLVRRARA